MSEQPLSEKKIDAKNFKKFEAIYSENIKFEISLYKSGNKMVIETKIPKDVQSIKYSNEYDLDTLKQTNKFLSLCETIDDVIDSIYQNATSFQCSIYEKEKDYELKIPVPVKSLKAITFILKENEKQQNEIINDLCLNSILMNQKIEEHATKIEQQNIKSEEQYLKIEEQDGKIQQLEMRIKDLEEQNKTIIYQLNELLKKDIIKEPKLDNNNENRIQIFEGEINPILMQSSRIIKDDLFKQLNIWINPTKSLKFELIYTASINGDTYKDFHMCCDGKGPTITLCKGDNGHIYGGYLTVPFSSDNKIHYDDSAFLFSLTNKKKFPVKPKNEAVCHYDLWGPYFGKNHYGDLIIPSKSLYSKNCHSQPNSYVFKREDLIGTKEDYFGLTEYEIFLVN